MIKSKGRANAKTRSGTKSRSKAKRIKPVVNRNTPKSKQAAVLALLSRHAAVLVAGDECCPGAQLRRTTRGECAGRSSADNDDVDHLRPSSASP
jgi:hypothetical protein